MLVTANLSADELHSQLEGVLLEAPKDAAGFYDAVVQAPFVYKREMALSFLGFITMFVLEPKTKVVSAVATTNNEHYKLAVANYDFCLADYKLPLSAKGNTVVQAITSGKPVSSDNWDSFRRPEVEAGHARLNQATSGIGYSVVYPLTGKVQAALMFNFFQFPEAIGEIQQVFMERYSELVSTVLA